MFNFKRLQKKWSSGYKYNAEACFPFRQPEVKFDDKTHGSNFIHRSAVVVCDIGGRGHGSLAGFLAILHSTHISAENGLNHLKNVGLDQLIAWICTFFEESPPRSNMRREQPTSEKWFPTSCRFNPPLADVSMNNTCRSLAFRSPSSEDTCLKNWQIHRFRT